MNKKARIIKGIGLIIIGLQCTLPTPGACKLIIEPIKHYCVLANGGLRCAVVIVEQISQQAKTVSTRLLDHNLQE